MAKTLKFETHTVTTLDNDGDEHESDVTSAVVDSDTAGQEVFLRNGEVRVLRAGEVVVPVGGGKYDVFTAKEWEDTWNDDERVGDHGGALRAQTQQDASAKSHQGTDGLSTFDDADRLDDDEVSEFRAWKARQESTPRQQDVADDNDAVADDNDADSNDDKRVQDAPVKKSAAPAKKTAASSGKRG